MKFSCAIFFCCCESNFCFCVRQKKNFFKRNKFPSILILLMLFCVEQHSLVYLEWNQFQSSVWIKQRNNFSESHSWWLPGVFEFCALFVVVTVEWFYLENLCKKFLFQLLLVLKNFKFFNRRCFSCALLTKFFAKTTWKLLKLLQFLVNQQSKLCKTQNEIVKAEKENEKCLLHVTWWAINYRCVHRQVEVSEKKLN